MTETKTTQADGQIISRLFFRLLPVQILIMAMTSVNSIIDGVMASNLIGPSAMTVMGLYGPFNFFLPAICNMLLGGSQVLCGRYMGAGRAKETQGVFSLDLCLSAGIGAIMSILFILLPGGVSTILGADEASRAGLMGYVVGMGVGLIPMFLTQQLSAFLQMERQSRRSYIGIGVMVALNAALDLFLVGTLHMGTLGLGLATALSNWAFFAVLWPYFLTKKSSLKFSLASINWKETASVFKIGFPAAVLMLCCALRSLALNRILLTWSGTDSVAALATLNTISGLYVALPVAASSVVRMLASISYGEEDRESLLLLMKTVLTKGMLLATATAVVFFALAAPVASIYFPDTTSQVYQMTRRILHIYTAYIPLIMLVNAFPGFYQATGRVTQVTVLSIIDGFLSVTGFSELLARPLGADGVWISHALGIAVVTLMLLVFALICWRRVPRTLDEWLLLREDFGVPADQRLDITIHGMDEVMRTSEQVLAFCERQGVTGKRANYSALCMEEMAGNIVKHGFVKDNKKHTADVRVVYKDDTITLRIKDDCVPFNPQERADMVNPEDVTHNIGVRMVNRIAKEVEYQYMMGLNVLTIRL